MSLHGGQIHCIIYKIITKRIWKYEPDTFSKKQPVTSPKSVDRIQWQFNHFQKAHSKSTNLLYFVVKVLSCRILSNVFCWLYQNQERYHHYLHQSPRKSFWRSLRTPFCMLWHLCYTFCHTELCIPSLLLSCHFGPGCHVFQHLKTFCWECTCTPLACETFPSSAQCSQTSASLSIWSWLPSNQLLDETLKPTSLTSKTWWSAMLSSLPESENLHNKRYKHYFNALIKVLMDT